MSKSAAALAGLVLTLALPLVALAAPKAGEPAPAFSLPRVDAPGTQTLAALKGKPVYLNFFASWCGPCNDEAPSIVGFYKKYHPKGLMTVGVDESEDKSKALEFAKKFGAPYEIVLDADGKMGAAYGAIGLPVHIFVDRRGTISTYRLGEMTPGEIEAAIKKIVAR
jgi:cytochrome c biogenesis protein CcmG, thiol:disulfide interchange protein DsbE